MANIKLTNNAQFFKEKDRVVDYNRSIMQIIQQIINEHIQFHAGSQGMVTTHKNINKLLQAILQVDFWLEDINREITCTPIFIRG